MSNLTKESMMRTYPYVLDRDKLYNGLGQTAAKALGLVSDASDSCGIYTRIEQLSESLLDILARDFAISWYNFDYDLETKRQVMAAAFSVYRRLGTKGAMLKALCAIWPETHVLEWFDYGGDPYHFKVTLDISVTEGEIIGLDVIKKTILLYKNERSYLDEIAFAAYEDSMGIKAGAASAGYGLRVRCRML